MYAFVMCLYGHFYTTLDMFHTNAGIHIGTVGSKSGQPPTGVKSPSVGVKSPSETVSLNIWMVIIVKLYGFHSSILW